MHLAGFEYPGHTEILAELTGVRDYAMMLVADRLRVVHVSTHVALSEAIRRVQPERELTVIRLADRSLRQLGIDNPRVAVAGLNPHAGEAGLFGTRGPRRDRARHRGRARRGHRRVRARGRRTRSSCRRRQGASTSSSSMYHDQGHIPIKLMGFDDGVNVTVGLPFVRTSVDHGTAFDIAGTGKADHASMRAALDLAATLARPVHA